MPISLEQWRLAVGRWNACIQRTLVIRRGVKRAPSCQEGKPFTSLQSHSGEKMFKTKKKARKKHKDDTLGEPVVTTDNFCNALTVLEAPTTMCSGGGNGSSRRPVAPLLELLGCTVLGALLVIMLLILQSGDVESNPGPVEGGASSLLDVGSKPTLEELDKLIVGCCSEWEQTALCLGVQSYVLETEKWDNPSNAKEACQGVLRRWLLHAPGTGETERTWHSVLEALKTSGHSQLAEQLKRDHFAESSEGRPIPAISVGASCLLDVGFKPTLEELNKLIVGRCSGWEQAALGLGVQSYVLETEKWDNPNCAEEACRGILRRWLLRAPGTGETERTWHSVLKALETSGHSQLAEQLKSDHFAESSERRPIPVISVGASCLLDVGSKPTLEELDELIVGRCSGWEQAALCLGVQSYVLEAEKWDNHGNPDEACRGVLRRWLLHAPSTGATERTWHSVLKALETSGCSQLAGQLKREHFVDNSERGLISPFKQAVTSVGDQKCDMMLRKFVSRVAGDKGRAVLEGLGLPEWMRKMCFVNNPSNMEESIQCGLLHWKNGHGYSPTWEVLLGAMAYAEVAVQDVEKLKEEILKGPDEGLTSGSKDMKEGYPAVDYVGWNSLRLEARPNRRKEDCKAVVTVHPAFDIETLDVGDYKYLRKAIQNATKNKKTNPHRVMKTLYHHTYHRVVNITANYGAQCFRDIMVVAKTSIQLGLVKSDIMALSTADTVADVLEVLHDDEDWKDTRLLEEIVNYLPEDARVVAVSLLDRYNSYLKVFEEELPVHELPTSEAAVPEGTRTRVEITVAKKITEYTSNDCKVMLHELLHICWQCPHDEDIVDVNSGSTTVVFLIDKAFTENIIQYSLTANSLWAFQELRVTRVRIGAFELNVVQLLTQHFKEALRGGLIGGMDFVGAIKALPYQVYVLVDPDTSEKLVIRTIYRKIVQPCPEQEELVSGTADSEGVEITSEMYEDNFPPKVEEEAELDDEGRIKETTESGEPLSRVQELEDKLKNSEWKSMDLTQKNIALGNHLKVCQEQKDHIEQEYASLKKRLVSMLSSQGDADKDSALTAPSDVPSKRIPRRWWLKVSDGSYSTSLLPSSPMKQREGSREMEGEVVFRRDSKSDLLKAVSGTEWMYQRGALERGRRVNLRRHQFTRYHRRWLADNVRKKEEDSCKLWLVQLSPDVGTVREREEHRSDEGKMIEEVTGSELLSRVQELEDELKDSERKRMDLVQSNTALQMILKTCQEQEVCAQQEIASLWERLGGADQDSALTAPSEGPLKRIPRRWWLKVSAGSYSTSLLPSSPTEQAEGSREMEGEVVFRRNTKSNLLKAVSGIEWMYRKGALERGRQYATANHRWHQFTRYHQSWLADNVQKEEEESCKQWLLQLSPDVMNKVYEQALRDYQEKIAGVLIVKNILSDLEPYLTKVEYLQVKSKLGNMAQVDELFRILLTKGNRHFDGFCHVLEDNGYQHWAQQLRSSTDGAETEAPAKRQKTVASQLQSVMSQEVLSVGERKCNMLFRSHVSRQAAGKGRAVLEGVGLLSEVIEMCYVDHSHSEEEAVQAGLIRWRRGGGESPTWGVLIDAMKFAQIAVHQLEALEEELMKGRNEGLTSCSRDKKENCLYDSPLALEYIESVIQTYSKMPITQGYPDVDYVGLKVIRSHPSEHKKEDTTQFLRNFQKAIVDYISQRDGGGPRITQKDQVTSGLLTHDYFLHQQEKQLHIIFGPPGVGKTSFSRQICSQFSSAPKSSSFSLVLLFYVREKRVAEAKTLADLLSCYGLPDDDLDHNELARLIVKSKGKGLQIIFDGLDECPGLLKDDKSIVTQLLKGQLAEAQIVVTSRPGIVTQLSELWDMASLYEVQGFSPEVVNEFVESFFCKMGDPSAASKFLSALANRPDLTGSTYIPLNLWLLCSVFSYKDCTLPDTLTQCYTALFALLLRRQAKKEGVELFTGHTLNSLPESMQTTLDCLSKLSYLCFLKQELVFDEEVVIRTCLSSRAELKHTFDGMSLLSVHPKQHGDMDHLTFNFLHSTYQEYLCAKHIHGMSKEEQTAFWKENISNPQYAMVFRFYCGLSQLQIKGVQDLVKGQKLPSVCHDNDRHLLFLFYALHESGNTDLTAAIASQLDGALVFQLKMSLYDFYVTGHCLSKAVHLTKLDFGTVYTQETTGAIPCMESVALSNPLLSLRLALTELSLLDAEKLTSALSALEELTLTLDVSSGDAIEEVLFIPTLKKLHLTVGSDSDWYTSLHPTSKSGVTDLDLDFPSKGLGHSCSQMEELRVVCDSKGASCILDVGSQPTLEEMDKLIVGRCSRWDQAALCLGVQPYVIEYETQGNPNNAEEACRRVLHRWLLCEPGTGETKRRTWHSVLEALETSGHSQLASQLKRDNFAKSSEEPISLSSQPVSSVDVGDVIASHLSKWKNLRKVEVWSMNPVPILWSTVSCDELVEVVIGDPKYCKVPADVGSMPVDLSAAHLRRLELLWTYGGDSEVLRTCLSIVSTCSSLEELDVRCGTPDAGQVIASHLPKWKNLRKVAVLFLNPMPILLSVRLCGKLDEVVIKYPEHCKPTAEDWQAVAVTMASAQQLKKMELWGIDVPFLETCIPKLSSCPSLQELRVHSQDPSAGQVLADNVLLLQSVETLSIRDINPKPILQVLSRNSKHSVSSMGISLEHKPDLLFGVCDLLSQCRTIRSFQLYLNKGPEALTALSHCLEGLCRSPSIEEVSISCLDTGAGPAVAQLLPNMVGHPVKLSVSLPDPTDVLESLQDSSVASLTLVMSHLRPMTPHDQVRLQALVSGVKSEKVSIVLKQEQQFPYNPWILHDISLARLAFISSVMK